MLNVKAVLLRYVFALGWAVVSAIAFAIAIGLALTVYSWPI